MVRGYFPCIPLASAHSRPLRPYKNRKLMDSIQYIFIGLFIAMLLGVIVEAVAQKKGKSFLPWWIFIAAIIALGVAAYLTLNHFQRLANQQENYAAAMGMGADQEERRTKRMNEQADAARKLADEIANVHRHEKSLAEISDEAVESIRRKAQAKAELAREHKQVRLDEIELAEKMHKISAQDATRQRTDVEIQSIKEEQAMKVNALTEEQAQRLQDYEAAKKAAAESTADYNAKAAKSTAAGTHGKAIDAEAKKAQERAQERAQEQALVRIEASYPNLERDWTFKTGAKRKARFASLNGNAVLLDFSDGQFTVPLENLSLFDQAVARGMAAAVR